MAALKNLYCSCFGVEYIKTKSKMADPNFKIASNPNSKMADPNYNFKMANDNVIT